MNEPKTRPWAGPQDVPLNCWIKTPRGNASFITHVADKGIGTVGYECAVTYKWSELEEQGIQWSQDRQTWHPCTVELPPEPSQEELDEAWVQQCWKDTVGGPGLEHGTQTHKLMRLALARGREKP